jgi:hypothetical protein
MPVAEKLTLELGSVKVALRESEYLSEFPPHRFPPGAVLSVSEQTAQHWYDRGIAVPAEVGALTHLEARRAKLEAELAALEAEEGSVGKYKAAMTAPTPRRGRKSQEQGFIDLPESSDEDEE